MIEMFSNNKWVASGSYLSKNGLKPLPSETWGFDQAESGAVRIGILRHQKMESKNVKGKSR